MESNFAPRYLKVIRIHPSIFYYLANGIMSSVRTYHQVDVSTSSGYLLVYESVVPHAHLYFF